MRIVFALFAVIVAATSQAATPSATMCTFHALALRSDGRVLAWGSDHQGELGQGRLLLRSAPAPIAGSEGVRAVAGGDNFAMALLDSGQVLTWGENDWGQRGIGTYAFRGNELSRPIDGARAIAATARSAHVLKHDGTVWSWGGWPHGRGETNESFAAPGRIEGLQGVVAIAAGPGHVLALLRDGSVWGWGDVLALGDFTETNALPAGQFSFPTRLPLVSGAVAVAAGQGYSLALRSDGTVIAWDGRQPVPAPVPGVEGAVAIAAGSRHSLALTADGSVRAWGRNDSGEQGLGFTDFAVHQAHPVPGLSGVVAIAAGDGFSLALTQQGQVRAWGSNSRGQLGLDVHAISVASAPEAVPGLDAASAIAAGRGFALAVNEGKAFAWGDNVGQQLASGAVRPVFQTTPLPIPDFDGVSAVSCGTAFSAALREDGTVWTWGANRSGQLGDGGRVDTSRPARVDGLPAIASIHAHGSHMLAVDREGGVWGWGNNLGASLASADTRDVLRPRRIALPERVIGLSAGPHVLAVTASNRVLAWGQNRRGQVGDGTTLHRSEPAYVGGLPPITAVAAGGEFSLALSTDRRVWAWGDARYGQRGIGLEPSFEVGLEPTRIESLADVQALWAGHDHALARLADGSLWGWGATFQGQLGTGLSEYDFAAWAPLPLRPGSAIAQASAGRWNTFAVAHDGGIFTTGWNTEGQLGDGTLVDRSVWQMTAGVDGAGVLDISPENPVDVPAARAKPFGVATSSSGGGGQLFVKTDIVVPEADLGRRAEVFVFALAPATRVKRAPRPKDGEPVACVLAQLTADGQLEIPGASGLRSYVSGVLGGRVGAVDVINGAQAADLAGSTFFVGYGPDASQVVNGGGNRSVFRIDGEPGCKPQPPQTGWWWNPSEPGRGYSIEASGNRLLFAAFMYEPSGAATWYVANGATSLDGSFFLGPLYSTSGGQTLAGEHRPPGPLRDNGPVLLAFNSATAGTIVWPRGGAIPIRRFDIVPDGLRAPAAPGQPESGWWWNPREPGRGFFLEWQGGVLDMAGYMYDEQGKPVWYLAVYPTPDIRAVSGQWWSYANGQALDGAHRPATRVSDNVAPVSITFSGPETALMTLPNGRSTLLQRHRF